MAASFGPAGALAQALIVVRFFPYVRDLRKISRAPALQLVEARSGLFEIRRGPRRSRAPGHPFWDDVLETAVIEAARGMGINSVPTFIVAGQHAVPGAQPPVLWQRVIDDVLEQLAQAE